MGNQIDNSSPIMVNDWADTSRWWGICSLLPYLISIIIIYLENRLNIIFFQIEFVVVLFCLFWGVALGSVSLITGIMGLRQINNSQGMEVGTRSAIFGILLGIMGIIANILFVFILFVSLVPS